MGAGIPPARREEYRSSFVIEKVFSEDMSAN
jgi:hypothetical protein